MRPSRLVLRGLVYYWRTNAAVVLGVATAVAVLSGALLVGDSVRGSLRDLVLQRLGRTDRIVVSSGFFREALADDLQADEMFQSSFAAITPIVVVQGLVSDQGNGGGASRAVVYGVDERFWRFHDRDGAPWARGSDAREALLSPTLASDIGASAGGTVLVRVERPSAIPIESLHGRKEDLGRTLRLTVRLAGSEDLNEFSLQPQQGQVRAVFVPLERLQQDLDLDGRVNTLLASDRGDGSFRTSGTLETFVKRRATLEDLGLTLRVVRPDLLVLDSPAGVLDPARATAADQAVSGTGMRTASVFTYLANSLRSGERQVPYSLVTAMDLGAIADVPVAEPATLPPIVLNDWAAKDLRVEPGDPLTLEYYVWEEPGRLLTRTADFRIAAVVPIQGAAADRTLAPQYPGITDAEALGNWDPPFPIDLRRVRTIDEEYWKKYRTTPKAFIPLEVGQALWRSRYGDRSSVRIVTEPGQSSSEAHDVYGDRLRGIVNPLSIGLSVSDVRANGLAASRGATDFGEYFTYFSFFLVFSALLLAALFFRLGVEQRAREVGLLRSVGYTTARIRRQFAFEGLVLAAIGCLVGAPGGIGYAAGMMAGLRTWWTGAVGTTALTLHVSASSLAAGAFGTIGAAMACVWWTLRGLARLSERSLLAGKLTGDELTTTGTRTASRPLILGATVVGFAGVGLLAATVAGVIGPSGAFFGAGTSLLVACLCLIALWLRQPAQRSLEGRGWWPVARVGLRNAAARPGRSVLAIGVIAAATFVLISVDAFRRDAPSAIDRRSGVGGYSLLVEMLIPIAHDPNSPEGLESLGLTGLADVTIDAFRLLPGDDASCLNLYEPSRPRILGASRQFTASDRFAFQSSLASTEVERANPWLLLNRDLGNDVVPVVADANSMTYVLHKRLGEDIVINVGGRPVRLRLMAALADSIFQSELMMSDAAFLKLFPNEEGYRFLLVETPASQAAEVSETIEATARDLGADTTSTTDRLAEFHRVENTYLSTFQMLGGLGLLVGTVGLAAVLLRNVLERRRELAMLGAVGYGRSHIFAIVLAENVLLLGCGLAVGALCAALAIAPALMERGGRLPTVAGSGLLLFAVLAAGLLSSIIATRAALRAPLLGALRSE